MSTAAYKIVVTDNRHPDYAEERTVLGEIGATLVVCQCTTAAEVLAAVQDADGVLCNLAPLPAEVIDKLPQCRVISRYGVGYDNVDVPAATRRGIWVANVPDYSVEDVSDHTLALWLACVRQIPKLDRGVKQGRWNIAPQETIRRVAGKTYGLIGYGLIARAVHRKLRGFNLRQVLVYDPFVAESVLRAAGATKASLEQLCEQADYISLHIPLTPQTRGLIGPAELALMKPTTVLVNVARGPVIDEPALMAALRRGAIHMAGLDVFATEPPAPDNPLLQFDNTVLSDHAGYYSAEAMGELKTKAARNVVAVLSGGPPPYPVNKVAGH